MQANGGGDHRIKAVAPLVGSCNDIRDDVAVPNFDSAPLMSDRSKRQKLVERLAVVKEQVENLKTKSDAFRKINKDAKLKVHTAWNKWSKWDANEKFAAKLVEQDSLPGVPTVTDKTTKIERDVFSSNLTWLDYSAPCSEDRFEAGGEPIAIECFGGSARLTRALSDVGFDATSIDWTRNKSRPVGASVLLDLTKEYGRIILHRILRSGRVSFIHFGPPCGTASRAREIPLVGEPSENLCTPKPLRSSLFPDGFEGLEGNDKLRVDQANLLYEVTASAVKIADELGIAWCIENPRSSYFWETSWITSLINHLTALGRPPLWNEFQHCAYGGERPKWSGFLHNIPLMQELEDNGRCPGNHVHKPWGITRVGSSVTFATGEETAYPVILCQTIAGIVARHVQSMGKPVVSRLSVRAEPSHTGLQAAEAGRQARGHKAPRLIAEYSHVKKYLLHDTGHYHALEGQVLKEVLHTDSGDIPVGSKVLRTRASVGGMRALFAAIPWDKEGFLAKARSVDHPIDSTAFLSKGVYSNIFWVLTHSPDEVAGFRKQQLVKLKLWKSELEAKEKLLHGTLSHEFETILKDKNILVFERALKEIGHKDVSLVSRLKGGFQLSGQLDESRVFAKRSPKNPEPLSKADLLKASKWSRHAVNATVCSSGDSELDNEVFSISMEEKANGWLLGPVTYDELDNKYPNGWVAARRFGVRQGEKCRPIDDFSVYGQNSTVTTDETIPLGGVDAIMSMARWAVGAVSDDRSICIPDGSSGYLKGMLHEAWSITEARSIAGQCVDLKSAYKQLVRDEHDRDISVIGIWNPILGKAELYESIALPFGSTGSVFGFNRCSYALRQIFILMFGLLVTSFFDDFPVLEYQCLSTDTAGMVIQILDVFGWNVSVDKLKGFAQSFEAIGVHFDFQGLPTRGAIVVQNTAKRKKSIYDEIQGFFVSGYISPHEAAALKGRMLYGEAQHWGRVLSLTTRQLSLRALGKGCGIVAGELSESLLIASWLICNAQPRILHPWYKEPCNLVYVDAAADDVAGSSRQRVSIGGVIFSERLPAIQFFGGLLDNKIVDHWQSSGSKQVVGQGELLPVLVAKRTWDSVLSHARNVYFIDNESARESLVRSYSPSWTSREILVQIKICDIKSSALDWYARVPTGANYADGPSRLNFKDVLALGGVEISARIPTLDQLTGVSVVKLLQVTA